MKQYIMNVRLVVVFVEVAHVQTIHLPSGGCVELTKNLDQNLADVRDDVVCRYSRNVLHLGMFYMLLKDVAYNPERNTTIRVLKVAMLYFKSSNF